MLPDTLDPDDLRTVAVVALVVLVIGGFLVLRFIQKMVFRVVLLGALAGLAVGVWVQRESLEDCVPECACTFFGYDVDPDHIPGCRTRG